MEFLICLLLLILSIILFKIIFKIDFKMAKKISENKELSLITKNFPDDITITKEILEMVDNKEVKIEQAKDTGTSLYIALTNKISIADMKNNYARIQTIAHECIHSVQDKRLVLFNFIFSNITIIYFIIAVILTLTNIFTNLMLQIFILLLLALIQFSVRSYLEIDAMTRAKFLAKDYIKKKNIITKQEENTLIKEYEKINKIGIPFVVDNLLTMALIRIIIFILITIIF